VASPNPPDGVSFHRTGIAAVGQETEQLKSFDTLIKELGHANNTIIDILKIDVEGAEFDVFLDGATLRTMRKAVRQILVEVHYKAEEKAVALARVFTDAGFYVFSKEPNIQYSNGDCVEFSLLNVKLV
jgi:Methyltransferase domain